MGLRLLVDTGVKSIEKMRLGGFRIKDVPENIVLDELPGIVKHYQNKYHVFASEGIIMYSNSSKVRYDVVVKEINRSEE